MELTLTEKDLKGLSLVFRSTAGRFLHGDSDDAIDNLSRFLALIENTPILTSFITDNQAGPWDIAAICEARGWRERYPIPTDSKGEIAFTYQLLQHIRSVSESKFHIHRFTSGYSGGNSGARDFESFSRSVVLPFVEHINHYLEGLMDEIKKPDQGRLTVNNFGSGQVNLAQDNSSIVAVNNQNGAEAIQELGRRVLAAIEESGVPGDLKGEIKDATQAAMDEVSSSQPKKTILSMCARAIESAVKNLPATLAAAKAGQELVDMIRQWLS